MGKRTEDAELNLTHEIANNDRIRALKGRQRIDAIGNLEASELRLKELTAKRDVAVKADADEAATTFAQNLKGAADDLATSRAAEKLAASFDNDVTALVAKLAKLTSMVQPRYEAAKQAALQANGVPDLIAKIEGNRKFVATAVGADRAVAAADQAWLNQQYTFHLAGLSSILAPLASIRHDAPQAADAIADVFKRIRLAFTGESPPAAFKTLADAHAVATAALERHVASIKQKAPNAAGVELLPDEFGQVFAVRDGVLV